MAWLEELSVRGYLLTRLRTASVSASNAALISSLAWAGGHLYQGMMAVGMHLFEGLALAWVFLRVRRLWPLALAHAGFNVLGYAPPY
jgi:membrane protease YdiL (CAAX protease family)